MRDGIKSVRDKVQIVCDEYLGVYRDHVCAYLRVNIPLITQALYCRHVKPLYKCTFYAKYR